MHLLVILMKANDIHRRVMPLTLFTYQPHQPRNKENIVHTIYLQYQQNVSQFIGCMLYHFQTFTLHPGAQWSSVA